MDALKPHLLASALDLQDELLGTTEDFNPGLALHHTAILDTQEADLSPTQRDAVHIVHGLTNQSWFFHSPLQYWSCSRDRILADHDIVATVNEKKNLPTSVNVTLRHSIVFSGKRFESRRLLAADALVITLLHRRDSPVGHQWERKAALLAARVEDKWDVYPPDGRISASRLYEFQFRPMSIQDTLTLSIAYGLAMGYFLMSLLKLRAVKSKIGLMVTVVTQVVFAIMSSFTVCAIFNIDLSRIPSAAYPLVILAMSLENIFRLIGAVIITPSEDSTSSRIGHAFGQTAPVALASSAQNVFILAVLSRLVSPGVAGFCSFLAVAIVFDVFYLSTFFLSVLSVDVRRTELSDALAKSAMRHHHRHATDPRGRKSWFEQIIQGKTALSTRIAGTFVMVGFVLIAQWHFFQQETILSYFKDADIPNGFGPSKDSLLEDINQARSPTSWLRLQDHETAQELISIIKPSSHSYVAQVYDPLVFVMKGSDRSPRSKEPTLLPAAYDFINHQLTQFVVIVILIVALLRLLISYLLWQDEASMEAERELDDLPLLSVKSLSEGHSLDIAMLSTSAEGHVISVGLDRIVRVWDVRSGKPSYVLSRSSVNEGSIFPVHALAIDDDSKWLALLSPFRVAIWSLIDRAWGPSIPLDLFGQRPEAFFFAPSAPQESPRLIIVRRNGSLVEVDAVQDGEPEEFSICKSALLCAEPVANKGNSMLPSRLSIVTAAKHGCDHKPGCIHVATRRNSGWDSREVSLESLHNQRPHQLLGLSALGLFVVATQSHVFIFNVDNLEMLHSIETEPMRPRSLQCAYSFQRLYLNAPGITTSTISYIASESGDCVMHTFVPPEDVDAICLRRSSSLLDDDGCEWSAARETKRRVKNPGHFTALSDGSAVGIRRKMGPDVDPISLVGSAEGLRNRFSSRSTTKALSMQWEAWTVSPGGKTEADEVQPLFNEKEQTSHLLISDLGPKVKVGLMSVAFCFGNIIKLVTVGGPERFEPCSDENGHEGYLGSRRRKAVIRPRTWSNSY